MRKQVTKIFALLICMAFLQGCISNPFGGDGIKGGNRTISGNVSFQDGNTPNDVYVWLEGMNVNTTTGQDGEFLLSIPADININSTLQTNGIFKLYFYMANYGLREKQVVVNDGEFVYNRGDVNKNGALNAPLVMKRFLRIKSGISPASVRVNYSGIITASVTLEALKDSVTVVFPNAIGGFLGAILLKKIDSHQVFIYEAIPGLISIEKEIIGFATKTRDMGFGIAQRPLPPGKYEVIPYLLIAHEQIPGSLIESLGRNVMDLTPNYLNIPYRRETAILEVTQ